MAGGPGALVWMEISALFGLSSKCAECLLAVKYRQRDAGGEMRGGPMYTMCAALRWKRLGGALAFLFALFTVLASLGMGDMAQANSIAGALADSFSVPARTTGVAVALLALVVILGGIRRIAGVCSVVVPLMAVLYLLAGTAVLLGHLSALPGAVAEMFRLAFSPAAAAGGAAGTMTASALNAARWGIARGCFSHEAGMGSAAILTTPWDQLDGKTILAAIEKVSLADELLEKMRAEHAADEAEHEHAHHHHDHEHAHEEHEHHHDHDHHDHEEHDHHHDHDEHAHHHDHDHECDDPNCSCHHHHHHADEVFTSWGKETPKGFAQADIERILTALDSGDYGKILRAKGIVNGEGGKWIEFDFVPEEHEVRAGHPDYTGRLCVIGAELQEDKLSQLFGL